MNESVTISPKKSPSKKTDDSIGYGTQTSLYSNNSVNRTKPTAPARRTNRNNPSINRQILIDKDLKLQIYREKKRQLEVKLRQHLQREALQNNGTIRKDYPKDYSKSLNRNINGYATMPDKLNAKSKDAWKIPVEVPEVRHDRTDELCVLLKIDNSLTFKSVEVIQN